MTNEIIPADRKLRRRCLILIIILALVSIPVLLSVQRYIQDTQALYKGNPDLAIEKFLFALRLTLGLAVILILMTGGYVIWIAGRMLRSGRYPPPGMRVVRDTPVLTGVRVKGMALLMILFSLILIAFIHFIYFYFPAEMERMSGERNSSRTLERR